MTHATGDARCPTWRKRIYVYINRWRWDHPVWIRDPADPTSDVGIEIAFDLVVDVTGEDNMKFRLTGRLDGLHWNTEMS